MFFIIFYNELIVKSISNLKVKNIRFFMTFIGQNIVFYPRAIKEWISLSHDEIS